MLNWLRWNQVLLVGFLKSLDRWFLNVVRRQLLLLLVCLSRSHFLSKLLIVARFHVMEVTNLILLLLRRLALWSLVQGLHWTPVNTIDLFVLQRRVTRSNLSFARGIQLRRVITRLLNLDAMPGFDPDTLGHFKRLLVLVSQFRVHVWIWLVHSVVESLACSRQCRLVHLPNLIIFLKI